MLTIALVLHGSAMLYEIAIASEVFGVDRSELSPTGRWYDLVVCTADGAPHPWLADVPTTSYAGIADVDTVVVPSSDDLDDNPDPVLLDALRAAHDRGARIASLCTGAFVLAAAGVLDGRVATTHWMHAEDLARRYPRVDVRPDVLYVDEGAVLTSAGKTAALDLCLHLVRRDLGATAANGIARRLVVPAHRGGGQAQFITPPAEPRHSHGLAPTLDWARARLDQPLTVRDLAGHANLSTRQLARRMRAELRLGPLDWLHHQRIARARNSSNAPTPPSTRSPPAAAWAPPPPCAATSTASSASPRPRTGRRSGWGERPQPVRGRGRALVGALVRSAD